MLKKRNFVKETTTTSGTGTLTLTAVTGWARFADAYANGDVVPYAIRNGNNREVGWGTVGAGNTLARTTVLATLVAGVYDDTAPAALTLAGESVVFTGTFAELFTAAEIAFTPTGALASTDVQAALAELDGDLTAHVGAADPHAGYVLESLFDANSLLIADVDNTPLVLPMGASTILARLASGGIVAATPAQLRTLLGVATEITHTWAVPGEIKVASGDTDFIVPFFVRVPTGQEAKLTWARHRINAGTSVTAKLTKNGVDVTGFTGISVTTTSANTDPADVALADGDLLALVVTAVSATPKNMTFSVGIEYKRVA